MGGGKLLGRLRRLRGGRSGGVRGDERKGRGRG